MEQGPREAAIIKACIQRGQPLPDAIQNAPVLTPELSVVWEIFWELDSCRPLGMTVGRIPWTAVDRYAQRHNIEDEEFHYLVDVLARIDNVYMEYVAKRSKRGGQS